MSLVAENSEKIDNLAQETLDVIVSIATKAKSQLAMRQKQPNLDVFAAPSSINTTNNAQASLEKISIRETENYKLLLNEPVIARVKAITEEGEQNIYYISRSAPLPSIPGSQAKFASYRSPIGRLAAIPAGDEVSLNIGRKQILFEILERAKLRPEYKDKWDSTNNLIEDLNGIITVPSFRQLIEKNKPQSDDLDLLTSLLEEEDVKEIIIKGNAGHVVIDRMGLRDQPILDQYQDEIFRLPLDSQLLILGPPGTGKTTTLIRRLGQKLDIDFLEEDERDLLNYVQETASNLPHDKSWIMFSPTELLKLYIKEAFNRESIPAPDERIKTWVDTRRYLARNVLKILKSGMGGTLTLSNDTSVHQLSIFKDSIGWFEDFRMFFLSDMYERFEQLVDGLINVENGKVVDLALKVKKILPATPSKKRNIDPVSIVWELTKLADEIRSLLQSYTDILDNTRKDWINYILRQDKEFLNEFSVFYETLNTDSVDTNFDDDDREEDLFQGKKKNSSQKITVAFRQYSNAISRLARAKFKGKPLSKSSRAAKVVEWLGNRLPPEEELFKAGSKLETQSKLRHLTNPIKFYLNQIPSRYLYYRKLRMKEDKWYRNSDTSASMIKKRIVTGAELDILVLMMFRHAGELIKRIPQDEIDNKYQYHLLNEIQSEYRHQVLVDEVSDFSPIQLACMMELAHPKIRSFFACGDLLQRVTVHGIRDQSQIEWVSKDFEFRKVDIAYRQSKKLTEIARCIANLDNNSFIDKTPPFNNQVTEGEKPILVENISGDKLAHWLCSRISEIEKSLEIVPSIAVFVDCEDEVEILTNSLKGVLQNYNIEVVSCPQGRVMGQDDAVRVFDVQHIKGLEFEAVFFVGADKLAKKEPHIFNKFLYVGATRAATYFGITCEEQLPEVMESLRCDFGDHW